MWGNPILLLWAKFPALRRKVAWEALHPVEIQVESFVPPVIGYASPPPQTKGFAAATAEAVGQTKQATNRALARAEAIGDDLGRLVTDPASG